MAKHSEPDQELPKQEGDTDVPVDIGNSIRNLAKTIAQQHSGDEAGDIANSVIAGVKQNFPESERKYELLIYAMTGAFDGASVPDESTENEVGTSKQVEKFKRELAIAFLQGIAPRKSSQADLSPTSSIASYGSALVSMASSLYTALKPGFTISTIATAIGMSSLFPVLGPATLVIGAAMLVRSSAIVVSSIFKCIRGTRSENDVGKVLNVVRQFIGNAPADLAEKFTGAIMYGAEKELTGTKKDLVETAVSDGLIMRDQSQKEQNERIAKVLGKNKRGYLAYLFNSVFQTNIGGAADAFWYRGPRKTQAQGPGKTASRSK